LPSSAANGTAAAISRFGAALVPALVSLPCGETNTASWISPSMPSQFESTNPSSGGSGAPGLIAGFSGAQSRSSTTPSAAPRGEHHRRS